MTADAVKGGCVFCGSRQGLPYRIEPFGWACPSCTDGFFSSRGRKGWGPFRPNDLADLIAKNFGPPYRDGIPLRIDVSDTDPLEADPRIEVVGKGCPDRLGGRGIYVYRGAFPKRVFRTARAATDAERFRLNLHLKEWHLVRARVAWIVWQETDGRPGSAATVKGYWTVPVQRVVETGRRYQTPNGPRFGPPLEVCAHYDERFHLKEPGAGLERLVTLAGVGKSDQ